MREILFRGKRIDTGEWVEGQTIVVIHQDDNDLIFMPQRGEDVKADPMDGNDRALTSIYGNYYQILPQTVGQYTGLTDKNGKKVFEGDVVKIIHKYQSPFDDDTKEYTDIDVDVVHFDDEGLCFSYGKSPFLCVVDNVTAEYEVIGNIYDDNLEELANGR